MFSVVDILFYPLTFSFILEAFMMQIKYDSTKDILFIDFTDKLTQICKSKSFAAKTIKIIRGKKATDYTDKKII